MYLPRHFEMGDLDAIGEFVDAAVLCLGGVPRRRDVGLRTVHDREYALTGGDVVPLLVHAGDVGEEGPEAT